MPFRAFSRPLVGTVLATGNPGGCALYGHFCKIDRIGSTSRRLLAVMATFGFI